MTDRPDAILQAGAKTFAERNAAYGDSYISHGSVMEALFPDGVVLKTPSDHNRFSIFLLITMKMSRYANNFAKGGHQDSIHDIMVYASMLESLDEQRTAPVQD